MSDGGIGPTIGGFNEFVTNNMGVPAYVLSNPALANFITYAFDFALQWVNPALSCMPGLPNAWTLYSLAIYNLAADTLVNIAQDAQPPVPYEVTPTSLNPNNLPYWQWLRAQYGVLNFVPGVVQSTSDEGTSVSYLVPKAFENFTVANLQNLKTPYGRAYLGIAQSYGTLWGLT